MRRTFYLIGLLALALGCSFVANADDVLPLDASVSSAQETASSMEWPMLPGESVHDLARLFYPKNHTMQQRFVDKTLLINAQSNLQADARFAAPTLLEIPTLKSLSKNAVSTSNKPHKTSLKMSYGLEPAREPLPQKLIRQYEELVLKNAFLKEELAKLNEKITRLQTKLADMKLIFDKTIALPSHQPATNPPRVKEKFKNLNKEIKQAPATGPIQKLPVETSFFDKLNMTSVKVVTAVLALLLLATFALKKYRERMSDTLDDTATEVPPAVPGSSSHFVKKTITKQPISLSGTQQVETVKEADTKLSATLEEAKQLVSVNRATDAIVHLKATITAQPKTTIRHWLYLLELFRKFNMKDDFEQYAERLHQTFNVITPVWYENSAAIYVPQNLEEFPHIMAQLYDTWPSEAASVYLRSLITDNRGGDRTGFGQAVLDEILMLIALLDAQKA